MISQNIEYFNADFYNFFALVAKDLNCTIKSLNNNYIFEVFSIDKNKKFYILSNSLPLNNNVSQKICMDKVATSTILALNQVNCVEHILLKNPNNFKNWDETIFNKLIKDYKTVVVKDNQGSCGKLVFKANSIKSIKKYANTIFKQNKDVAISPYIDFSEEYRLIMLNNKCEIIFKKIKPFVVGDGKTSALILAKNKYGENAQKLLDISNTAKKYTPKKDEKFVVGWKNNLKMLASVEDVKDKILKRKLEQIAKSATKALGATFCSVDIVEAGGIFKVLEVNSTVTALGYAQSSEERQRQVIALFKKAFLQVLNN